MSSMTYSKRVVRLVFDASRPPAGSWLRESVPSSVLPAPRSNRHSGLPQCLGHSSLGHVVLDPQLGNGSTRLVLGCDRRSLFWSQLLLPAASSGRQTCLCWIVLTDVVRFPRYVVAVQRSFRADRSGSSKFLPCPLEAGPAEAGPASVFRLGAIPDMPRARTYSLSLPRPPPYGVRAIVSNPLRPGAVRSRSSRGCARREWLCRTASRRGSCALSRR
ncbi:hypothetical protein DFR76_101502 [Nocardia pseudobrasiliensis]|uniref:Uncharacterized protein n=1 Tax=Nocardia pseudobrasiliensis TaxID=45979 RepID=A0A370IE21_9NOCA|nr:hypothetical protein DFR76_101502 [Nocardia pseudobrasiliensis]